MSSGHCKLRRSCYRFLMAAWWGQLKSVKNTGIFTDLMSLPFSARRPPPPRALNLCLRGTVSFPPSCVLHLFWKSSSRCSIIPQWGFSSIFSINKQSCRAEATSLLSLMHCTEEWVLLKSHSVIVSDLSKPKTHFRHEEGWLLPFL